MLNMYVIIYLAIMSNSSLEAGEHLYDPPIETRMMAAGGRGIFLFLITKNPNFHS
jgi:hypothetical protein